MDEIEDLVKKGSLNVNDACFLLQFLQRHTAPLQCLSSPDSASAQPSKDPSSMSSMQHHSKRKHRSAESHSNIDRHHLQKYLKSVPKSNQQSANKTIDVSAGLDIDITSLDEFPPVSVQDKRCVNVHVWSTVCHLIFGKSTS